MNGGTMPRSVTVEWEHRLSDQIARRGPWYFRLAYRILSDAGASEDACQQAFCQAWQFQHQIQDAQALGGWLTRAVINQALAMLRRRRSEQQAILRHPALPESTPVDEAVARKEAVWLALDALEPAIRDVVVMRLIEGRTGNEVKALMRCSASEVSKRLHAGLDQLREHLAESTFVDGGARHG
jgi:RNA polymerase sigma factor (sigma-70 family)